MIDYELVIKHPQDYLITEENQTLDLGDYYLNLPLTFYRVPYSPKNAAEELIIGRVHETIENNLYFRRLDLHDEDDILYKAWVNAQQDSEWNEYFEYHYRKEILRVNEGEQKDGEGSFDFGTGKIDFIRSITTREGHKFTRYKCMYYPDNGNWRGCSLFSEHLVTCPENTELTMKEDQDLSAFLLSILSTVAKKI